MALLKQIYCRFAVAGLLLGSAAATISGCDPNGSNNRDTLFPPRYNVVVEAQSAQFNTAEDTALMFSLTATGNVPAVTPRIVIVQAPTRGRLQQTGRDFVYTPNLNFNGEDSIAFAAVISGKTSDAVTASIIVTPVNDPPLGEHLVFATDQGVAFEAAFSATDPEGDEVEYGIVTEPVNGSVDIDNLFGTFRFVPDPDFVGTASFYYQASDGSDTSGAYRVDMIVFDDTAPNIAGVTLANGDPVTRKQTVQLAISTDASASEMRLSGDVLTPAPQWRPFAAASSLMLTPGDGTKTVSVQVRDSLGNRSPVSSDTIFLDQTGPDAELTFAAYTSQTTVTIGIAATDPTPPLELRALGDVIASQPDLLGGFVALTTTVDVELTAAEGPKAVTFEFNDGYGQRSTETATILLDQSPPTGRIGSGLLFVDPVLAANFSTAPAQTTFVTNGLNVPLTIAWQDTTSPATAVVLSGDISNPGYFLGFNPADAVSGTAAIPGAAQLVSGDGPKWITGAVVDAAGNIGAPFGFRVTLDTMPPTLSGITLANGAPAVNSNVTTLDVTASTDAFAITITASPSVAVFPNPFGPDITVPTGSPLVPPVVVTYPTQTASLTYGVVPGSELEANAWVFAQDRAGNVTGPVGRGLIVDLAVPSNADITAAVNITDQADLPVYFSDITEDGVHQIELDGDLAGGATTIPATDTTIVTLTANAGIKTIAATFVDLAGNRSAAQSITVAFDGIPFSADVSVPTLYPRSPTVPVWIALSGVQQAPVTVAFAGDITDPFVQQWLSLTSPVVVHLTPADGAKAVTATFRDAASNEVEYTAQLRLDRLLPQLLIDTPQATALLTAVPVVTGTVRDPGAAPSEIGFVGVSAFGPNGYFDGAAFGSMVELTFPTTVSEIWSYAPLTAAGQATDGSYQIFVTAADRAGNVSQTSTIFALDTMPPTGQITTATAYSRRITVDVFASYNDANSVTYMTVTGDVLPAALAATTQLQLETSSGDGAKHIFVTLQDAAGLNRLLTPLTVTLDTVPPAPTALTLAGGAAATSNTTVSAQLFAPGAATYAIFGGQTGLSGPMSTTVDIELTTGDGTKAITAVYFDTAGNAASVTATIELDQTPPTVTLVALAGGADAVSRVTTTIDVTANGAPAEMQVTGATTIGNDWLPFVASRALTLATGDGLKTVWLRLRDALGNTAVAVSDGVVLDTSAPAPPTSVSATAAIEAVELTWAAVPGADAYRIYYALQSGGPYAATGATQGDSPIVIGAPTTNLTLNGFAAGTTLFVVLTAQDEAGNASTFSSEASAIVLPNLTLTIGAPFMTAFTSFTATAVRDGAIDDAQLGAAVAAVGDLNNDGRSDFVVAAPDQAADAFALSGTDFSLLFAIDRATNTDFGTAIDGGRDLNGDDRPDIVITAPGASEGDTADGAAYAFSGTDGSAIRTFAGNEFLLLLGQAVELSRDLNGDNIADLLIGASESGPGRVVGRSSSDGAALFAITGASNGDRFGAAILDLGDISGDDVPDFAVGAPNATSGYVRLISGADRSTIRTLWGAHDGARFGATLLKPELLGLPVLVIGAPQAVSKGVATGAIRFYNYQTGALLASVYGLQAGAEFGSSLAGITDWDGDGQDEYVIGAPGEAAGSDNNRGAIYLLSELTLGEAARYTASNGSQRLGAALAGAAIPRADGTVDLVAGAPGSDIGGSNRGRAYLLRATGPTRQLSPLSHAKFLLTGTPAVVSAEVRYDGGTWRGLGLDWAEAVTSGLAAGGHAAEFRGIDANDNRGTATAPFIWFIDTTPPDDAAITFPAGGATVATQAVSGTVTDPSTTPFDGLVGGVLWAAQQISTPTGSWWDGYGFSLSAPTYFYQPTTEAWSLTAPYSTPGTYEIRVQAVDGALQRSNGITSSTFSFQP